MAKAKFNKGSEEWMMFTDFWMLCQTYWEVEKQDEYWQSLIDKVNEFCEKYKEIPLAKQLANAIMNAQEEKYKKIKK